MNKEKQIQIHQATMTLLKEELKRFKVMSKKQDVQSFIKFIDKEFKNFLK